MPESPARVAGSAWRATVAERLARLGRELEAVGGAGPAQVGRPLGPDDPLPASADDLIETVLARARDLSFEDYRHLAEQALPSFAATSDLRRAAARR